MPSDEQAHDDLDVRVVDDLDSARYEIWVGDTRAGYSEYRVRGNEYSLAHTVTEPEFEGQGLAGRLVRTMLDDLRNRGIGVLPHCPFVRAYIHDHREYVDLVPVAKRAQFGLV
jgi:predicted GNAT family acetyltransferase